MGGWEGGWEDGWAGGLVGGWAGGWAVKKGERWEGGGWGGEGGGVKGWEGERVQCGLIQCGSPPRCRLHRSLEPHQWSPDWLPPRLQAEGGRRLAAWKPPLQCPGHGRRFKKSLRP